MHPTLSRRASGVSSSSGTLIIPPYVHDAPELRIVTHEEGPQIRLPYHQLMHGSEQTKELGSVYHPIFIQIVHPEGACGRDELAARSKR